MNIESCYFCVQDTEKLDRYQCCVILPVFKLCSFFQQPGGDSGARVPRAKPVYSITIYIGERELALYICATTHGPTSLSC